MYTTYTDLSLDAWKAMFDDAGDFIDDGEVVRAVINMMGRDTVMGEFVRATNTCTVFN